MKLDKKHLKKFWNFLWHDDSLLSYLVNFVLAFLIIKYLFFPGLGLVLGNEFPVVAIVSGSMEHKIVNHQLCNSKFLDVEDASLNFDQWWRTCGDYYEDNLGITKAEFRDYPHRNGLNTGDVMILYGKDPKEISVGEVLVFIPEDKEFFINYGPVIHRVVKVEEIKGEHFFTTKGDHNAAIRDNFEVRIPEEDVIGVASVRIPFLGYPKFLLAKAFSTLSTLNS